MLTINKSLRKLELGWNNFYGKKIFLHFFMALRQNDTLIEIGLSFNGFTGGDGFAREFNKTMIRNNTLESINLENNLLSGIAGEMSSVLLNSTRLLSIYLGGNPWLNQDIETFINAFARSKMKFPSITTLSFGKHQWITMEANQVINLTKKYKFQK